MLEKFKKNAISPEHLNEIKGGMEVWSCSCGGGVWHGTGSNGAFRDQVIENGCANTPTYCNFHQL